MGRDLAPNDHGTRITNTFLANTEKARLVQLNGWARYRYAGSEIEGSNAPGLIYQSLNVGSGIFWSATDDSPTYDTNSASAWGR